jgi:predicted XRE-type DNA-binding protein
MSGKHPANDRERNVWLQLGFADAETHFLKAELVLRLDRRMRSLRLTQAEAARRIGTTQPELSKILRGKFSEVSLERLMRFLASLGHRIDIQIGTVQGKKGNILVSDARPRAA